MRSSSPPQRQKIGTLAPPVDNPPPARDDRREYKKHSRSIGRALRGRAKGSPATTLYGSFFNHEKSLGKARKALRKARKALRKALRKAPLICFFYKILYMDFDSTVLALEISQPPPHKKAL